MPRLWRTGCLGLLVLALLAPIAQAQVQPAMDAPVGCPVPFTEQQCCDPACNLYSLYVMTGVKFPFELYARTGASFVAANTRFDDVLDTGIALEFGARAFCFDVDRSAAWFADVGVDYLFNKGDENAFVILRFPLVGVTTPFGTEEFTPAREEQGIKELHRIYGRLGGGREWYWGGDCEGEARCFFGVDAGIRVGHASAKLKTIRRIFLDPEFDVDDIAAPLPINNGRATDLARGFYVGGNVGIMMPCCGYEFLVSMRAEYGYDAVGFPGLFETDDSLTHVKVLGSFGVRF